MKRMRNCAVTVVAALLLSAAPAHAGFLTDLWWKADEPGWGANVVHQDDYAFVTLFVYSPAGEPMWYFAATELVALTPDGLPVMSGTLYRSRGPWFGGVFDPGQVRELPVGTLSIAPAGRSQARFEYDVEGIGVSKLLARQPLQVPVSEPDGLGYGVVMSLTLRAADRVPEKSTVAGTAELQLAQGQATLVVHAAGESCFHLGPIALEGKFTNVSGAYACSSGRGGSFELAELEFTRNGFVARISMTTPDGVLAGTVAGAGR